MEKLPGVPRLPIVGTYYSFLGVPKEEVLDKLFNLLKLHGNFARGWNGTTPEIHIQKAEHIEIIMNNSVHITKGIFYNKLHPWLGEGLLTSTGQKWFQHRKLITPTFHFKILENFMVNIVEKTETLLKILDGRADGEAFNIYTDITHCTLDIICETAMGVNINAMSGEDNDYVKAIYNISDIILWRFMHPYIPDFIFRYLPHGRRFEQDVRTLHKFSKKVISDRKEALSTNRKEPDQGNESLGIRRKLSFLDLLLEVSEDGKILSDTDIREEVDTFMFEGHDTTTAAMAWNLLLLGNHQEIQEKAYVEIKTILQDKLTPTTLTELNELKYLERVIKESLRNSDHYPEPDKFDPDRFLPENCIGRHPYAYIPFSAGPRNCIGDHFNLKYIIKINVMGHATTAAMSRALLLLGNHPEIQEKAYEEIKTILNKPIPTTAILDQYKVQADTQATIHIYCIQRSADYYPDPGRFDPDRFLPENVAKKHP
ncbi:cytochrome p450 family 4 [Holotrichia oblita]|uniref:Cytochrome p450 family 4 n=1 Tax=Holotrichia oblita TaxID=644536 RepID=A0ACB9TBX3_HOLOL|nr:cytochrome p450 family 4 [Holotrichia oblita]